jgi:DNA-directed RNA polymerase specialized sigma24 family protein
VAPAKTAAWLGRAYERHGEVVYAYAFHLTGARDEAERLSVAAFMDAHGAVAGGASIRGARVWLLRRVHERAPILPHDRRGGTVRHLPPAGASAMTAVRAELARLEPPAEEALVLRQWCGLRPAEIAAVLGVPAARVRRALREDDAAAARGRSARHMAAVVAGAGVGIAAAEMRAGVPQALASTVPGFAAGSAGGAAGIGMLPFAAAALKAAVVVGAAAAAIGTAHAVAPDLATPWRGGGGGGHESGQASQRTGDGSGTPHRAGAGGNGGKGSKPARSHHPSKPAKPGKPAKPQHPSHPAHPTAPTHPTKPSHPAKPAKPTHPAHPTHPTNPRHPAKPTRPAKPTEPSKPGHPAKPAKPSKPSKPATS